MCQRLLFAFLQCTFIIMTLVVGSEAEVPPQAPQQLRLDVVATPIPPYVIGKEQTFLAHMSPLPGVESEGSGYVLLTVDKDAATLTIRLVYTALSSARTVSEIVTTEQHAVRIDLATMGTGETIQIKTPPGREAEFLAELRGGKLSAVVNTEQNPSGEIEGPFTLLQGSVAPPPTPTPPPALDLTKPSMNDSARFLQEAAFGGNYNTIKNLSTKGIPAYLDGEFKKSYPSFPCLNRLIELSKTQGVYGITQIECYYVDTIGSQQLRARVAAALSEIFVVSVQGALVNSGILLGSYYDILNANALGNFRNLMEAVTLHRAMGVYLSTNGNWKADPVKGTKPNENYAREILQLFTIGLFKLHQDGSLMLDDKGAPIPTYTQADIPELAKVFTGWRHPADFGDPWNYNMILFPQYHETAQKSFLGLTIPAGGDGNSDLKAALDFIFNHPNVGPFIGKQLIQRLVKSNPSPAYVWRVAKVFNDNGKGVRGDLKAVVEAILTDYEARAPRTEIFKLKEPMIKIAEFANALNLRSVDGRQRMPDTNYTFGQRFFNSPTVFNFFRPDYSERGPILDAGLVAPEFQIFSSTALTRINAVWSQWIGRNYTATDEAAVQSDLKEFTDILSTKGLDALIDRLDLLLAAGTLTDQTKNTLRFQYAAYGANGTPEQIVRRIITLVAISPETWLH